LKAEKVIVVVFEVEKRYQDEDSAYVEV